MSRFEKAVVLEYLFVVMQCDQGNLPHRSAVWQESGSRFDVFCEQKAECALNHVMRCLPFTRPLGH